MIPSLLLRARQRSAGKLLLLSSISSFGLQAFAQQAPLPYSPSPAVAGSPVTFTLGTAGQPANVVAYTFSLAGPQPGGQFGNSANVPVVNGTASYTTPPLAAGIYELEVYASFQNAPSRFSDYYFTVYGPGESDVAALQGQYIFQLSGSAAGGSAGLPAFALGSFTADGKGNVTAGAVDINSPGAVLQSVPVTGTYQLSASGAGTITLNSSQGPLQFSLLTPPLLSTTATYILYGLPQAPLPAAAYLPSSSLVAGAGGILSGNGALYQSEPPKGSYPPPLPFGSLSGSFNASLQGGSTTAAGSPTSLGGASQFTFTGSNAVTTLGTLAANGATFDYTGLSGTLTTFDPITGRSVMTLPTSAAGGAPAQDFAVYQFNINSVQSFYFLSLAPRDAAGNVTAGRADQTGVQE